MSNQKIVDDIIGYVRIRGGQHSDWYVGISNDAQSRLFNDHRVYEQTGAWIFRTAYSSQEARETELYLIQVLGFDGGPGGGNDLSKMIYAYRKTLLTNP